VAFKVRGHSRQAGQTSASAQGQHEGFNLIVAVVPEQHVRGTHRLGQLGQSAVAPFAGRGLGALTGRMLGLDVLDVAGHAPTLTLRTDVRFKTIGGGLQAVVHVQRDHISWPAIMCGQGQGG
jgi:hypothetical protein